ncbi:zinc finger protein 396-like [Eublepharis macularius]|uniref:Zinc finger protein 396-like n=1 Tax=Eublepharis macularius TaxID=481883 RepID=A0AA97J907_EUBMA|nr:zinc finger protein 396-like [Eublepharis macularius]
MTTTGEGGLQSPVQLEQGVQTDIKMEEESPAGYQWTDDSRKAPHILQSGNIREFLQRRQADKMKQEPSEGQLQRWEVQWLEFLKTVETSPSSWKNPQLLDESVFSGKAQTVPSSLQGQPVTSRQNAGEQVAQVLPPPHEACNRLECGGYGQVKEETESREALSPELQRQRFRQFLYLEAEGPHEVCSQLREFCCRWLQPERHTKEQILELIILEQFLAVLPPEMLNWVKKRGPETCFQAAALAEEFLLKKQASEGPEEQGLEPREGAALNTSKAMPASLDHLQMPVYKAAEQESDAEGGNILGKWLLSMNEEEKYALEGFNHAAASNITQGREKELSFQSHRGESRCPHRPEQKGNCPGAGTWKLFPSQPEPLFKTIIQYKIHPCQNLKKDGGRGFQQTSTLVKCEHTEANRKPYSCSECGKAFFMFSALRTHQRTHIDHKGSHARGAGHTTAPYSRPIQ